MAMTVYVAPSVPDTLAHALANIGHDEWQIMHDAAPPADNDATQLHAFTAPDAASFTRARRALERLADRVIGQTHDNDICFRWLSAWHAVPASRTLAVLWHPWVVAHLPAITRHPLIRSRYAVALRELLQPHRDNGTDTLTLPVTALATALATPEHYGHDFTRLRINALQPAVDGLQTALNWPLQWRPQRLDPKRPRAVTHVEFTMPDIREGHGQHPLL